MGVSCCSLVDTKKKTELISGSAVVFSGALRANHHVGNIHAVYEFDIHDKNSLLSAGATSSVWKGFQKDQKQAFAIKSIKKSCFRGQSWNDEVATLKKIDHPNLCRLFDTFEDKKQLFLVFEYCKGGDLTAIGRTKSITEGTMAVLVRQMVSAVAHLHKHGLVHGDLKCTDWLFMEALNPTSTVLQMHLKMIDFGLSDKHCVDQSEEQKGGKKTKKTPCKSLDKLVDLRNCVCRAPEVLDGGSAATSGSDVWSLGVLSFFVISGQPPFSSKGSGDLYKDIQAASVRFEPANLWNPVSGDAKAFIKTCLTANQSERPESVDLLEVRWMHLARDVLDEAYGQANSKDAKSGATGRNKGKLDVMHEALPSSQKILSSFRSMHYKGVLEKAAIAAAAHRLQDGQIGALRTVFEKMDRNGDGVLSAQELCDGLKGSGVPTAEIKEMLQDIDMDGSGMIEYTEFVAGVYSFQGSIQEHAIDDIFSMFDVDGSGSVSKKELAAALGCKNAKAGEEFLGVDIGQLLKDFDKDGDGMMDRDEFKKALKNFTKDSKVKK